VAAGGRLLPWRGWGEESRGAGAGRKLLSRVGQTPALGAWFGLVWFGLVWFGLVWFGLGGAPSLLLSSGARRVPAAGRLLAERGPAPALRPRRL